MVRTAVAFRYGVVIGTLSVAAAAVGLLIGALAGSGPEWVDNGTMGLLDVVSVFPGFVLALTVAAAVGPSLGTVTFAITVVLVPNCLGPVLTQTSIDAALAIMIAAGLSFIGFGVQPPTPEWGLMINEGSSYVVSGQWWVTFFPGLAILSVVMAFFLVDNGLEQAWRRH